MSEEDMEVRKAVRKLLKLTKLFQARAMGRETALRMILQLSPKGFASLTGDEVENLFQESRKSADGIVSQSTARLEQSLETGTRWLDELEAYTSSLLGDE